MEAAARSVAPHVRPGNLVILESTSPVGTTEQVAGWIRELRSDLVIPPHNREDTGSGRGGEQVYFAHCPERVLPGQILKELVDNDRVVGGLDVASARRAEAVYRKFVNGGIHVTDARTAELCKLTENAYRDANIAFANELSLICDRLGVNVWELIRVANRHPRVKILQPGPGVGGHCIAVDPWFIVHSAPDEARLIRCAREVNDAKPHHVIHKVLSQAKRFKEPTIACLGLAFKADVDDLRESPAVELVAELARSGAGQLIVVEPHVSALPVSLAGLGHIRLASLADALASADIVVLLVNHRAFIELDRRLLQGKLVIDTRGLWQEA